MKYVANFSVSACCMPSRVKLIERSKPASARHVTRGFLLWQPSFRESPLSLAAFFVTSAKAWNCENLSLKARATPVAGRAPGKRILSRVRRVLQR